MGVDTMVWLWNADGIPGPVSPATTGRSMRRCCCGDADGVLHRAMPRMTGHLGGMVTVQHPARPPGQDPHDHQGAEYLSADQQTPQAVQQAGWGGSEQSHS